MLPQNKNKDDELNSEENAILKAKVMKMKMQMKVIRTKTPDLNFDVYIQVVIIPDVSDKFTYLEIQLDGENCVKIPRYTCACHKADISVNKTIKAHIEM